MFWVLEKFMCQEYFSLCWRGKLQSHFYPENLVKLRRLGDLLCIWESWHNLYVVVCLVKVW